MQAGKLRWWQKDLFNRDLQVVEVRVNKDLDNTTKWFRENGMQANPEKYQALRLGNTDYDMNIKCCENTIPLFNEIKLFGVTMDNKLKFGAHIVSVCRKVSGQVN